MDFATITIRLQTLWQKVPQKRLTQLLLSLLMIYIAYWLASFTWLVIPQGQNQSSLPFINNSSTTSASQPVINTNEIKKLNLFGEYNQQATTIKKVEKIESAPETRLKLTLTGLVASDDEQTAAAIIESQGKQETYGIDEKIQGTRAILKQVQSDRVIIESAGRLETLMLDGFEYSKTGTEQAGVNAPSKSTTSKTLQNKGKISNVDPEKSARMRERVAKAKEEILNNPGKLTDYIKISPHRVEGEVKGYRLMPSKDPEFFQQVGLIPGDVAVQINGKDLTDMREAQKALIELRTAEQVDLLVERDGVTHSVSLGLNN